MSELASIDERCGLFLIHSVSENAVEKVDGMLLQFTFMLTVGSIEKWPILSLHECVSVGGGIVAGATHSTVLGPLCYWATLCLGNL